jgi:hypothetical protein
MNVLTTLPASFKEQGLLSALPFINSRFFISYFILNFILDPENNIKADIAVPKRSFGKIAGSFVEVRDYVTKIT